MTDVLFAWVDGADDSLGLPRFATEGSAGADLRANLPGRGSLTLARGEIARLPTGLRMAIPAGFEVQIRPRSGLAARHGVTVLNAPGTIDADYRGPVEVLLINLGGADVVLRHGDRIAQMVVAPVERATFRLADTLPDTARGAGGFGSTGGFADEGD